MYALTLALALARAARGDHGRVARRRHERQARRQDPTGWLPDDTGSWTSMSINFMSGSDDDPIQLQQLATGIDATDPNATTYGFTAPNVNPYSQIYFLQL
jgi:hypothetical protein